MRIRDALAVHCVVPYRVTIRESAEKEVAALPRDVREAIDRVIGRLADEPRPVGVKKLKGVADTYRVYFGAYRVVYEIHDKAKHVRIVRIAGRKDVYR